MRFDLLFLFVFEIVRGAAADKYSSKALERIFLEHELRKPVIGSKVVPAEARTASRARMAGVIGAAIGFSVGYYFGDDIDEAMEELRQQCQSMGGGL